MISDDKMAEQAKGYSLVPSFEARPLEGPGRWAVLSDNSVLYTDDENILFARNKESTPLLSQTIVAIDQLYTKGLTATAAFDKLRGSLPAVSGDLSEIA